MAKLKEVQKPIKVTVESQKVRIDGEALIFFKLNMKDKKIKLDTPDGVSDYFRPLMQETEIEKHEKFLKTYKFGIDYCKKLLKQR